MIKSKKILQKMNDSRVICPGYATEIVKFYKGCFIATAVYEDYNHPEVMKLREFRVQRQLFINK